MTNRPVNRDHNHYKLARAFLCKESSGRWNAQHWTEWELELVLFSPRHIALEASTLESGTDRRRPELPEVFENAVQADHNIMVTPVLYGS